ncbi:MAG: hypothetical protein EHM64_04300 [Ignavibacteriae bacterium]|nr:MAG: hypothetical protein EHM64_04300 [Ignavibacteriota bacterium]
MKKTIIGYVLLASIVWTLGFAQESWQTHTRGLLHQSVFNTGALGVQYNSFRAAYSGDSLRTPFEWPGNSYFRYNNQDYWYYNSNGGGLVMLCDTGRTGRRADYLILDTVVSATTRGIDMIGCLGLGGGGTYRDGTGIFYWPGPAVTKRTNYPFRGDGSWNPSYDPTEAEEIITSTVKTPYGITITRDSRAWSYPGYDGFIIYDYKFENTGDYYKYIPGNQPDTLSDIAISWIESFYPSYMYANQSGNDFTTAASKQLSRFDLKRWMQYVHSPDGRPEPTNYAQWSANGINGGGLTAPAAVGYMFLYFDYNHLMDSSKTRFKAAVKTNVNEQRYVWDANAKFKQPWVIGSTQANLSTTKILSHVQGSVGSRYNVWNPSNSAVGDVLMKQWLSPQDSTYWYGRARPNNNYNYSSPMVHSYALGPYLLAPHDAFHVVVAEVAGFGPGRKADAQYRDYGGGNETTIGDQIDNNFHPIPSWDSVITYRNAPTTISSTGGIGVRYTPEYGIPSYIRDPNVVSIRDVADRCIQLYKGGPLVKYDTSQYEPCAQSTAFPRYAPSPSDVATRPGGWNAAIKIPLPSPVLNNTSSGNTLSALGWNSEVENPPGTVRPYLNAGLAQYQVLRSTSKLGPWTVLETVNRHDSRYWSAADGSYNYPDTSAKLGSDYFYAVVSVDSLGKKSGLTNIVTQRADFRPVKKMNKVYAVPNPFFFVSGAAGHRLDVGNSKISFYGLAKNVTIRIFSFSGQLIRTVNVSNEFQSYDWDLRTETQKTIASGVYYFTVQDNDTGDKAWNKFVVIH